MFNSEGLSVPFSDAEFQAHLKAIDIKCQEVFDQLASFEPSITFDGLERCFLSFTTLLKALEDSSQHFANTDRLLCEKELVQDLGDLLTEFEQYNLLEVFKNSIPADAEEISVKRWKTLAKIVEDGIVQLRFLLGVAKKEQHG